MARRLGELTGLPVVHLDRHYWRSGWDPTPADEWAANVDELLRSEEWIMDGNYGGTMTARIEACDTVIFLKLPRTTCISRVIKRRIENSHRSRNDLPPGCPEQLNWEFLSYLWNYPATRTPEILARLAELEGEKRVEILDNVKAVESFLHRLRPQKDGLPPPPNSSLSQRYLTAEQEKFLADE